jgi:hypothetical protein
VKYVVAFGGSRSGPALLEDSVTRASVASECREAALEFMAGVAGGWEKADLASWLTGPYAQATRHSQHGERTLLVRGAVPVDRNAAGVVDPDTIEDLLTSTRGRILAGLEKAALGDGTLEFAADLVERGLVRQAFDGDGMEAWVPVDAPRMRLKDRVTSLFVADYLNDRVGYGSLYVCHRCEAVVFDESARELGMCSAHRRMSGIVSRNDDDVDAATS